MIDNLDWATIRILDEYLSERNVYLTRLMEQAVALRDRFNGVSHELAVTMANDAYQLAQDMKDMDGLRLAVHAMREKGRNQGA